MTKPDSDDDLQLRDNEAERQYEILVDGKMAGFAEYRRRSGRTTFTHTVVDPAFGGRGLGSKLVKFALDAERAAGHVVVPQCPFVAKYIDRHPEYADLIAAPG